MSSGAIESAQAPPRWRVSGSERFVAALLSLACLSVLILAAWLRPAQAGHGTHTQLGLPACPWASNLRAPCPTCGMTTAFSLAAHGRPLAAFLTQPFGFALALLTAAGFWAGVHIAATGAPVSRIYERLLRPKCLWAFAGLAVASWAYKWLTWP